MKKMEPLKILGLVGSALAIGVSIFNSVVEDKKLDDKVTKAVEKAIAEKTE